MKYRLEGEGRPLLLVHGLGIPFHIWQNLAPLLRSHFRLVMVALPGLGDSPLPPEGEDYLAFAIQGIEGAREALGVKKWDVLGYSTGSRIAEAYIREHASHVCRAVFLCPLQIDIHKARVLRLGLGLDHAMPAFGTWVLSGWRLKILITWLGFNMRPERLRDEWNAEIGAAPVRVLKETIRAMMPAAAGPFRAPAPHAMIWGDRDLVPQRPRRPGAPDYFVRGRHAAPLEAAGEVAGIVVEFLSKEGHG